jgi:hypothetical protein
MWPAYEEQILYWSNFLQLVFLPIITVGTAIMSRGSEARAKEDHNRIRKEFELMREHDGRVARALQEIGVGVRELLLRPGHISEAGFDKGDSSDGRTASRPQSAAIKSVR